jgi:hypothetical protein
MFNTLKTYTPPRVLQETEVQLERDFLGGSVVENLNEAGVFTMSQDVEVMDYETEEFNFKWE